MFHSTLSSRPVGASIFVTVIVSPIENPKSAGGGLGGLKTTKSVNKIESKDNIHAGISLSTNDFVGTNKTKLYGTGNSDLEIEYFNSNKLY